MISYTCMTATSPEMGTIKSRPLVRMGTVTRAAKGRAMTVRFHQTGNYLGVQGAGRGLEIYRVRGDKEAMKKQKRRLKRKREKMEAKAREAEELGDLDAAKGSPRGAR